MAEKWLSTLTPQDIAGLKVFYLANDAPSSSFNGELPKYYNTGYHQEIFDILIALGINTWSSRDIKELIGLNDEFNYVFTLLNRIDFDNSEIFVSSYCEYLGIKYLGAKPNIRALAEDKHLTKLLAKHLGIPTSDWALYRVGERMSKPHFEGPYFVKWRFGAGSREVDLDSYAHTWSRAKKKISILHKDGKDVIVERLLTGSSITVPVLLDNPPKVLPPVVTHSDKPYGIVTFDQARRVEGGMTRTLLKDDKLIRQSVEYSKKIFNAIDPCDYIRVDYKVDDNTSLCNLLEFNICCNISSKSAICLSANSINVGQSELIAHILKQSLLRQAILR